MENWWIYACLMNDKRNIKTPKILPLNFIKNFVNTSSLMYETFSDLWRGKCNCVLPCRRKVESMIHFFVNNSCSALLGHKAVYYDSWLPVLGEPTFCLTSIWGSVLLRIVGSHLPDNTEKQSRKIWLFTAARISNFKYSLCLCVSNCPVKLHKIC